jgi:hypothetical protein
MMRRLAVIATIVLFTACGPDGPVPTHRGTYVGGEGAQELNIFTPCGDTTMLWVEGKPATIERLRKAHQTMTRSVFQPIYIEVRGRTMPRGNAQLDQMYTGVMHIDTVLTRSGRAPMACAPKFKPMDFDIG